MKKILITFLAITYIGCSNKTETAENHYLTNDEIKAIAKNYGFEVSDNKNAKIGGENPFGDLKGKKVTKENLENFLQGIKQIQEETNQRSVERKKIVDQCIKELNVAKTESEKTQIRVCFGIITY
jgi:hypothetical protein